MKLLAFFFTILLSLVLITFAVLNLEMVPFTYSPVHPPVKVPLYALPLAALLLGYVLGAFNVWINSWRVRLERRRNRKEIKSLQKKLEKADTARKRDLPPDDFFPALPDKS